MSGNSGAYRNYFDLVRATAERSPDGEALVLGDLRLSYADLIAGGEARTRQLGAVGVRRGDRFGVITPNDPAIVEFLIAGAMLGATLVPINTRFKARELRHIVTNARLAAVFTTDLIDDHVNFADLLREALPELAEAADASRLEISAAPDLRCVARVHGPATPGVLGADELDDLAKAPAPALEGADGDDAALILYTSGTTADPKGCVLSQRAVILDAAGIAERFEIPADDRWWNPLPMFHGGGLMLMSGCFVAGATAISMPRFELDEAFELIERERATVVYPLFPTITLALMHDPRFADLDRERIRVVTSVAPPEIQRQIQDAFAPAVLMSAYGITELCATLVFTELDDPEEVRLTSCGRPMRGFELKVVDPDSGERLPPGGRGELCGRGPSRFDGYFENEPATTAVIDDEGFFHTGDLCSIDADGRVFFHGRLKDMLKVGGENVAALEIESFLASHDAIKMAQVVGVPDDRLQEVPAAFVELVPGAEFDEDQVIAYCKGSIAGFKVPRVVRFVEDWPMSATKIQKFRLRQDLLAELGVS